MTEKALTAFKLVFEFEKRTEQVGTAEEPIPVHSTKSPDNETANKEVPEMDRPVKDTDDPREVDTSVTCSDG